MIDLSLQTRISSPIQDFHDIANASELYPIRRSYFPHQPAVYTGANEEHGAHRDTPYQIWRDE
jgi:hypothetical protein